MCVCERERVDGIHGVRILLLLLLCLNILFLQVACITASLLGQSVSSMTLQQHGKKNR